MSSLIVAETDFALNLLKQTPIESAVFSPLSIAIALSVLFIGAKDKTKSEIGNVLLQGENASQLEGHFGSLVSALEKVNETEVDIATRFFLAQNFPIRQAYRQSIQSVYKADAVSLNFREAVKAAQIVNSFVNNATNGKISKLVKPDTFKEAVAVLVNAIYFNNSDFEFAIILPRTRFGLRSLHKNITGAELQELFSKARKTRLNLIVPKFHLETTLPLKRILKKLGVTTPFSNNADFSLISSQRVKVSDAIHKAIITVAEAGTEAAAATGIYAIHISLEIPPPKNFHADHPFLYAVLYKNRPLFLGQYF